MDDDEVRRERLRGQRLAPRAAGEAVEVVRAICGAQAQDAAAGALSVGVRAHGLTAAAVAGDRGLVRTWAWRGTLHLLAAEDVPWVLSLVAPGAIRGVAARWRQLELDEDRYARAREVLARLDAPLERAALRQRLNAAGVDASGQRLPHLLRRAALEGLLQAGPGDAYSPLGPLPEPPAREPALAQLGRRYLAAFGPAEPRDLAAWSGLPAADVEAAWAAVATEPVTVAGRLAARLAGSASAPAAGEPVVRLLPAFDTALLGHRTRELAVAPEHARRVRPGGGWIHPVVLVDGRAQGTWRRDGDTLAVAAFGPIPREPLEREAAHVGSSLGRSLRLA